MNTLTVVGNVAADPKSSEKAIRLRVVAHGRKPQGEEKPREYWYTIWLTRDMKALGSQIKKGDRVVVVGNPSLDDRKYTDNDGQEKRYVGISVFANAIGIVPKAQVEQQGPAPSSGEPVREEDLPF